MSSHFSGQILESGLRNSQDTARAAGVRDLRLWLPPGAFEDISAATWTHTYDATNRNWHIEMTASATDFDPAIITAFNAGMFQSTETADAQQVEAARGPRINSLDLVYAVTTNTLDNFVVSLDTVVYNNIAAPTVTDRPLGGTLILTVTADPDNPSVTNLPVTTPFVLTNGMIGQARIRLNGPAGTSGFRLYGMWVNYDLLI